jgi:hypothetical protein
MNIAPDDRRRMMDEGRGKGREKRKQEKGQRAEDGMQRLEDRNRSVGDGKKVSGVGNGGQPATLTIIIIKPEYRNTSEH